VQRIPESYIWPELYEKKTLGKGVGVFARKSLMKGRLLGIAAGGKIWTSREVHRRIKSWGDYFHQVDDSFHWGPKCKGDIDLLDRFNHSCAPNIAIIGNMCFYALRNIGPGEELVWDYATTESDPHYGFICRCGTPLCRRRMLGNDWKLPELQERYAGHFAPYLQKKIQERGGSA
jgi:hypothetical protein